MKRWIVYLVFSAAAAAQVGQVPDSGADPTKKKAPADKPAEPAAGRGAPVQPPAAGRGAAQTPAPTGAARGAGASTANATPAPKDLKYPPLRPIQVPNISTVTLPNGLKLSLLEDHELPMISGVALVRAGTLLDPPEKIGMAAAAGSLLRTGGTALKTAEQVDSVLEGMAATIESSAEDAFTKVSFGTVKENVETVLGLFKEVLTQPEFRQDKIDLVRSQMRAAIAQRNDDPAAVAHREFSSVIYGKDNAFGWIGQYATVDRISRNDLRNYYRRYFFPANTTLGIWGDFDAAQMKTMVEKVFAEWNGPAQPPPEFPKVTETPGPGVYLAERKELNQTYFVIGHMGGRVNDKDAAALQVVSAILGSGSHGRLPLKVRAKTGATDEIRAVWNPAYDHPGVFEISGNTRSVGTVDVIKVILAEIDRIRTTEVTEEELQTARDALLNSTIFAYDTRAKLMGRQMVFDFFGYPKDYLQQSLKAIQAVTRADVLRAAKQHIVPSNLAIVAVASPQMFGEPLESLSPNAPVSKIDLTIPEARPEAVPTTDTSLAEGKQLLQKAQVALGGVEKLSAVTDYTIVAKYQVDATIPNIGGSTIVETDKWIAPTSFRQDSTLASGHVAAYTDGRLGWISTPQGWGGLSGAQQKQVLGDLFRLWFRLMLSDRLEGRTVNAVDTNAVQVTDTAGQEAKLEFDPDTGLPRRVTYDTVQSVGAPLFTEDVYDDYRDVNGIKMPFKITINQGGRRFADVTVTEHKLNTGIKTTDLARRPQ